MASKDEAATTTHVSDLFGDTDSSDESVGATAAVPKKLTNNSNDASPKNNEEEKEAATSQKDDVVEVVSTIREDTKLADSDDEEEVGDNTATNNSSQKTNNAALFGDDDTSSSEDDEFQDDGNIIGTKKKGDQDRNDVTTNDFPVVKTMNQTLGLDSDSDDDDVKKDGETTKEGTDGTTENQPAVYVPPRKMELLTLRNNTAVAAANNNNAATTTVYHTVKLPNLVGINTTPYNSKTHDIKSEEEYYQGYVHNMIRWRYKYDEDTGELLRQEEEEGGGLVRESNTRLVKWSDGSYALHVGQEVLEVDNLDSSVPLEGTGGGGGGKGVLPGFSGINGYLYASQKARIRPPTKKELEGPTTTSSDKAAETNKAAEDDEGETKKTSNHDDDDDDDDEVPPPTQPGGTVLECLGPIKSRFAPRPSSLTSTAHRNLTLAVRQRNVKRARIAEIVTDFDPESEKAKRIKSKDDLAKNNSRAAARGGARRSGGGGGGRRRGMNASYLEDDDDYDGVNLGRLKRQTMRGDRDNYSEDEEELDYGQDSASSEEDEWSKKKTQKRGAAAARAARKESEEEESSEDGEVVFKIKLVSANFLCGAEKTCFAQLKL
ncbi:hypothetical protein ACHAWT_008180 [Skeletonema menzelii]